jgi:hypothetical protein
MLFLDGLTGLDLRVARSLAMHEGVLLSLGGLTDLAADVAGVLAAYRGVLSLTGVEALADAAAQPLAARAARVVLTRLTNISETAEAVLRSSEAVELGPRRSS